MNDAALSYHRLESGAAGTYAPNRAFIRLQKASAFWKVGWSGTSADYAVFLHEYMHYLHNFSTGAGITELVYEMSAAQIFLMTVGPDGKSGGLDMLAPWLQEQYRALQKMRHILRGDYRLPREAQIHSRNVDARYVGHLINRETIDFPRQAPALISRANVQLEVHSDSAEPTRHTLQLGSFVVMESVAFELECFHLEQRGADIQHHALNVPLAPYKVGRCLLEGITGTAWSHAQCVKACLLALQATDAGFALIDIAERVRLDPAGNDEVLEDIAKNIGRWMDAGAMSALTVAVANQINAFSVRPLFAKAMGQFEQQITAYMTARVVSPFLELALASADVASPELYGFFEQFPPCVVQVLDFQSEEPMPLEYIWGKAVDSDLVDSLAGYHAMMDFALAHCAIGLAPTTALQARHCPFIASCTLPTRVNQPDVCTFTPWRAFDPSSISLCWYGAGVGASRGATALVNERSTS
jgi:hypothetical protein